LCKKNCFVQNKALLSVEIDDELVMMSSDQKNFMALNATGKFIFDYLISPKSFDEIIEAVMNQFEVNQEKAFTDIKAYLRQLISHQVLIEIL
jgi:DNA-binding NtrC family response regulator